MMNSSFGGNFCSAVSNEEALEYYFAMNKEIDTYHSDWLMSMISGAVSPCAVSMV